MKPLRRSDLDRFFRELADRLPVPIEIVLTGGAEALLLGGARVTLDVDFQVDVPAGVIHRWHEISAAIGAAAAASGVVVQYSQDIDRWSAISVPPERWLTRPHEQFGKLGVRLLDPACWSIDKLARYLESDREDLVRVLSSESVSAPKLADLAGTALRMSPRSSSLFLFRRQFEHFVRQHGHEVWGSEVDASEVLRIFRAAAGISSAS